MLHRFPCTSCPPLLTRCPLPLPRPHAAADASKRYPVPMGRGLQPLQPSRVDEGEPGDGVAWTGRRHPGHIGRLRPDRSTDPRPPSDPPATCLQSRTAHHGSSVFLSSSTTPPPSFQPPSSLGRSSSTRSMASQSPSSLSASAPSPAPSSTRSPSSAPRSSTTPCGVTRSRSYR